jgi:hypothetical protein
MSASCVLPQHLENLRWKGLLPRLDMTDLPVYLVGYFASNFAGSALRQRFQQRLGLLQVGRVKPLGKPAVD